MNIVEFEQQLHNFLNKETHQHRHKLYEVDMDLVVGYLNYLSKVYLNNCYEFDHQGDSLMVFLDCYQCGMDDCAKTKLDYLLKEFKKLYRCGFK